MLAPSRLGPYHLLRCLARGRTSDVFLARAAMSGGVVQTVAIKLLRATGHEVVRDFLREIRVAGCMNHPNLVQVFDAGEDAGRYFAAMEYLSGWSLAELSLGGSMPVEVAVTLVRQLAAGAHHLHQATGGKARSMGLVHRAITPSNAVITDSGRATLLDFGAVGRVGGRARDLDAEAMSLAAPEVLRGEVGAATSDVYSLGMLLHRLVHGGAQGSDPGAARRAELAGVIARAVHPSPRQRFRSAADFATALDDVAFARGYDATPERLADHALERLGPVVVPRAPTMRSPRRQTSRLQTITDPVTVA